MICHEGDCQQGLQCPCSESHDNTIPRITLGYDNPNSTASRRKNHFICVQCFSPYVQSICGDPGKFKNNQFSIGCPFPQCTSIPWTTQEVISCLMSGTDVEKNQEVITLLIAALTTAANHTHANLEQKEDQSIGVTESRVIKAIADALCLRCPSQTCKAVLDPNPDGCCAVRCTQCSTYFCWLCFQESATSKGCHDHVRQCKENPVRGDLFLSHAQKVKAQKKHRLKVIVSELDYAFGAEWREEGNDAHTILSAPSNTAVKQLQLLFDGTDITPFDIIPSSANTGQRSASVEQNNATHMPAQGDIEQAQDPILITYFFTVLTFATYCMYGISYIYARIYRLLVTIWPYPNSITQQPQQGEGNEMNTLYNSVVDFLFHTEEAFRLFELLVKSLIGYYTVKYSYELYCFLHEPKSTCSDVVLFMYNMLLS